MRSRRATLLLIVLAVLLAPLVVAAVAVRVPALTPPNGRCPACHGKVRVDLSGPAWGTVWCPRCGQSAPASFFRRR